MFRPLRRSPPGRGQGWVALATKEHKEHKAVSTTDERRWTRMRKLELGSTAAPAVGADAPVRSVPIFSARARKTAPEAGALPGARNNDNIQHSTFNIQHRTSNQGTARGDARPTGEPATCNFQLSTWNGGVRSSVSVRQCGGVSVGRQGAERGVLGAGKPTISNLKAET